MEFMYICPALKSHQVMVSRAAAWSPCQHSRSSAEPGIHHLPLGLFPPHSQLQVDHRVGALSVAIGTSSREKKVLLSSKSDLFLCFIELLVTESRRKLATIYWVFFRVSRAGKSR